MEEWYVCIDVSACIECGVSLDVREGGGGVDGAGIKPHHQEKQDWCIHTLRAHTSVSFEIPMYNVSSLTVRYLRIAEKHAAYKPYRWVRSLHYVLVLHTNTMSCCVHFLPFLSPLYVIIFSLQEKKKEDKTRQDKTSQDKTNNKTREKKTRKDKNKNKTRQTAQHNTLHNTTQETTQETRQDKTTHNTRYNARYNTTQYKIQHEPEQHNAAQQSTA